MSFILLVVGNRLPIRVEKKNVRPLSSGEGKGVAFQRAEQAGGDSESFEEGS